MRASKSGRAGKRPGPQPFSATSSVLAPSSFLLPVVRPGAPSSVQPLESLDAIEMPSLLGWRPLKCYEMPYGAYLVGMLPYISMELATSMRPRPMGLPSSCSLSSDLEGAKDMHTESPRKA